MKTIRPTIKDVARAAGVSMGTVSRVAGGGELVKPKTRERVHAAMRDLGYQPNAAARAMRTNSTKLIGFLIPDLRNQLFAAVARAAESKLTEEGYVLFLFSSDRIVSREISFLSEARTRGMDGLILSLCDETSGEVIEAMERSGVPIVLWDRDIDFPADVVFNDHAGPMRTVTGHLIELGHKRIALISAPLQIRPGRERVRGFNEAIEAADRSDLAPVVRNGRQSSDFGFEQALELMQSADPPTAIIAGGNDIFHGVMKGLRHLGLSIPREISIIGTDDRLVSEIYDPAITVIDRDMEAIGGRLAAQLLARLKGESPEAPVTAYIPSMVKLRSSTSRPRTD